jgi:hypothetical protein
MTRGPLPARTYWVRRLMVFGTAVLLVFAIGRLLGGGSDGSDGDDAATLTAETPTSSVPTTAGTSETPTATDTSTKKPRKGRTSQAPVLAAPTGPCVGSDIVVEPHVRDAVAGRDVTIVLRLRTLESEACTWRVSPDSVTLKITSGDDRIWSSSDCPRAIPRSDVVVRKEAITKVNVVWTQAKRSSDDGCTARTDWAMPGWYHATAAVLGGEPSDLQFELTTPTAETITKTATPKQTPSGKPSGKASGKPKGSPSGSPSGAVEPD